MALAHLTDANFAEEINSGIVLVDFWATWCGPCRMFGPVFESASSKFPNVKFAKFEIDESNRQTPTKYGIRSIPSVLAFANGELREVRTGLMDEETLGAWIDEITTGANNG